MSVSALSPIIDHTQTLTREVQPPPPPADTTSSLPPLDFSSPSQSSAQLYTKLVTKPHTPTTPPSSDQADTVAQSTLAGQQAIAAQPADRTSPQTVRQGEEISAQVQALNSQSGSSVNVDLSSPAGVEAARIKIAAAIGEQQAKQQANNPLTQNLGSQASPVISVSSVVATEAGNRASGMSPYTAYAAPENYAAVMPPRGNAVNTHG